MEYPFTNKLAQESSPYLLQHAHNPVDWYPWGDEALDKAKKENKMLLISIGYSSCHWCHVMEHESFEDPAVAEVMNAQFVCIKVDREERPDIDQIYMEAVQLLTRSGGWPLNCFALPDGRPFYGGTYYKKDDWVNICNRVAREYREKPEEVEAFADKLTEGVVQSDDIALNDNNPIFHKEVLEIAVREWSKSFDSVDGGGNQAPKFPLPNNHLFLLRYAHLNNDFETLKHVKLTLDKMALGGINDQLAGGFARYATDMKWLIPHFEKMLYDNAQLLTLYAEAYQKLRKPLYKEVVLNTFDFCSRELSNGDGLFYSALDADSEGEEGKFYVWREEELKMLLGADFDFAKDYYNINENGYWENGNYILMRSLSDEDLATQKNLPVEEIKESAKRINKILLSERAKRTRPGLDDKILTSWNGLMLKGMVDSYVVTGHKPILETALKTAVFLTETQRMEDGGLYHSFKNGKSTIIGFLEDYAFVIEGLVALFGATGDEHWLLEAEKLADYASLHFLNKENGMFYFTSNLAPRNVARRTEVQDNVIPSSNSAMARNLFYLGHLLERGDFLNMAETMLNNIQNGVARYPAGFSNWGILMMHYTYPFYELAISGDDAMEKLHQAEQHYNPNKLVVSCTKPSDIPLLLNRFVEGKTLLYVCRNKACQLPTEDVAEALKQLN
jgi:uncharacterized protein YyaL (SSP411 family)